MPARAAMGTAALLVAAVLRLAMLEKSSVSLSIRHSSERLCHEFAQSCFLAQNQHLNFKTSISVSNLSLQLKKSKQNTSSKPAFGCSNKE